VYALGGDRFVVLLPGVVEEAAASWAERMRETVAELEFPLKGQTLRITASCGVAAGATEEDSERLSWNALEALRSAKSSGRNCVARFGEFAAESDIDDAIAPLKVLQDSVARDLFIPCNLELRGDDSLAEVAGLFRRTRLPAFAVVNGRGELAGLLSESAVRAARSSGAARVADAMSADVTTFDEWTDFLTLLQYFAQHPEAVAIVVRDGRPTGLLTADSLLAPVDSTEKHPAAEDAACERASEADPLWQDLVRTPL